MTARATAYRVAIGGFGTIGAKVARRLDDGIPGLTLVAVSARDRAAAAERIKALKRPVPVLPLSELAAVADVVVECAPAAAFDEVAEAAIAAGRIFMPMSCAALLTRPHLEKRAAETGARIVVPTGALVGFDAVRAAAEGTIHSVTMKTEKPPKSVKGAPHLEKHGIDVSNLAEPLLVFKGSAREAAIGFPANVNVAAALSMAGIGADRTTIEIWADPAQERNKHTIKVDADSTRFTMIIEGIPSPENPATGLLTPLSVIATLRGLVSTLHVGT
ncbi:MAG: aspartate dehydrogenase [Alphaproteobacteria bacterium]|nr:aspartate dehydrogenase [Alphaproteobacteria bacterium]